MTQFVQCMHENCLNRAQFAVKLCVPPKGFPVEANKHISMIIGVQVCEDHMVTAEPLQFINGHTYAIVELVTKGKVPPDYERAFILPVPLDGEEWKTYLRQQRKGLTQ